MSRKRIPTMTYMDIGIVGHVEAPEMEVLQVSSATISNK